MIGVSGEEHIREELLKAVSSIARPVFNIRSDRLVQLHQKVLRWGAQLLDNFVPLIDVWGINVKGTAHKQHQTIGCMCLFCTQINTFPWTQAMMWITVTENEVMTRWSTTDGGKDTISAGEQHAPPDHLSHYAANWPHIHWRWELKWRGRRACKQKVESNKKKKKNWWECNRGMVRGGDETQERTAWSTDALQGLFGGTTSSSKDTVPPWEEDFMSHHFR